MSSQRTREQVLASEQSFFDDDASRLSDDKLLIQPDQMARYREACIRSRNTPKDTLFAIMQPLQGKRVLEYGCGMGEDSCHLADCGATVTSFDLSPGSIAKATQRAQLLGLSDKIHFDVQEAGKLNYPQGSFDVVMGIAILHHLHTQLDVIYDEARRMLKPDGVAYFTEPVANSALLRGLRPLVPVRRHATPDERQLTYADFDRMKAHGFRQVEYFHFHFTSRLARVFGAWSSPFFRRVDHYTQRVLPFMRRLYGIVMIKATV